MVALAEVPSERRRHLRFPGRGLVAEIRGTRYAVRDISFGGMTIEGKFTAGGLLDAVILSAKGTGSTVERAEVRGRVERVDGGFAAVRFSNLTQALARLIERE